MRDALPAAADLPALRARLRAAHEAAHAAPDWSARQHRCGATGGQRVGADGVPMVRCTHTYAAPPEHLWDELVVRLPDTCTEWNDVMRESQVLRELAPGVELARVLSAAAPLWDREDVFVRFLVEERESFCELSVGVSPEAWPVQGRAVRSNAVVCTKHILPGAAPGTATMTVLWHYHPMGVLKALPGRMLGRILLDNLLHEQDKLTARYGAG